MTDGPDDRGRPDAPVLFLSANFPPEVNALANRTWEHARAWAADGGRVEVVTGPPHFPEGRVYDGYENRLSRERRDGVDVVRVPMYVHPNEGFLRRTLSYVSFMLSAAFHAARPARRPGVVVASSPQFFTGLAGWIVSRALRRPFVLEIRDLWPESIVDVGAMRRGLLIRALEALEGFLYRSADHVVVVSPAFHDHVADRGVPEARITVLPNGVELERFARPTTEADVQTLRERYGLAGRFVASYIGTVGMAHGVEVVLEAARRCEDPAIVFLVVGAGAEWEQLRLRAERARLSNFVLLPKQPREDIPLFYALSDVSLVLLRDRPAFRKVIPSKMFESMALRRPVVLGVRGQAREILDASGAGVGIPPDDADALVAAVERLRGDAATRRRMADAGPAWVAAHYDRRVIAKRYWDLLQSVAALR